MKVLLEISTVGRSVSVMEHDGPILNMGRDPECELAVEPTAEGVSWRHARIELTRSGAVLHDLGSTNGTFVNDCRITEPTPLQPKDVIRLGQRGPQVRFTAVKSADETDRRVAPRPTNPAQPPSDPLPTMAGGLSPLLQKKTQAPPAPQWFLVPGQCLVFLAIALILLTTAIIGGVLLLR